MAKKYPMNYNEYEKRVKELLFEGMSSDEKKETEKELKELLEEEPDMFRHLYSSTCGYYDQGQNAFSDGLLLSRPVQTILMSL